MDSLLDPFNREPYEVIENHIEGLERVKRHIKDPEPRAAGYPPSWTAKKRNAHIQREKELVEELDRLIVEFQEAHKILLEREKDE